MQCTFVLNGAEAEETIQMLAAFWLLAAVMPVLPMTPARRAYQRRLIDELKRQFTEQTG